MSNLGLYQQIPILMHKVGGPRNFIALSVAGTIGVWEIGKRASKFGFRRVKKLFREDPNVTVTVTPEGDVVVTEAKPGADAEPKTEPEAEQTATSDNKVNEDNQERSGD